MATPKSDSYRQAYYNAQRQSPILMPKNHNTHDLFVDMQTVPGLQGLIYAWDHAEKLYADSKYETWDYGRVQEAAQAVKDAKEQFDIENERRQREGQPAWSEIPAHFQARIDAAEGVLKCRQEELVRLQKLLKEKLDARKKETDAHKKTLKPEYSISLAHGKPESVDGMRVEERGKNQYFIGDGEKYAGYSLEKYRTEVCEPWRKARLEKLRKKQKEMEAAARGFLKYANQ